MLFLMLFTFLEKCGSYCLKRLKDIRVLRILLENILEVNAKLHYSTYFQIAERTLCLGKLCHIWIIKSKLWKKFPDLIMMQWRIILFFLSCPQVFLASYCLCQITEGRRKIYWLQLNLLEDLSSMIKNF